MPHCPLGSNRFKITFKKSLQKQGMLFYSRKRKEKQESEKFSGGTRIKKEGNRT